MKGIVGWFASNPVAANLLMMALLIGGAFSYATIRVELFPEFTMDMISVSVPFPGSSPEEVEEGICIKIEEEIHNLEGIKRITSTASENMGSVFVEVEAGADARRLLDDVKARVDAISTFPDDAERPTIVELTMRQQVIELAVFGEVDEYSLKHTVEEIRDDVARLDGISQVEVKAVRPYEISIEVSETDLRRHGLTFDQVADAVRRSSIDLAGGSIRTEGGEILLRTNTQAYRGETFEALPLLTLEDGSRIVVGDVAEVIDGFEDVDLFARFNGMPAALVQIFRTGDESALGIAAKVKDYAAEKQAQLPDGLQIEIWGDRADMLQGRLDLMIKNGLQGLALLSIVLALFLRFRLALWITVGIPVCFLGTFLVMPTFDASLNMLSLFGFILVLGIVVDDAIVVGESIFTQQREGEEGLAGAKAGVQRVSVPVIFAVLTSVAAFTPLVYLPGVMGKFFAVIPLVVIPCLLFSLVESQLILPAHLSHESRLSKTISRIPPFSWWIRFQGLFARGLELTAERIYKPTLEIALRWRYVTVAAALAILLLAVGLVQGGFVRFAFFNAIESDWIAGSLVMPEGTPVSVTADGVAQIEAAAKQLKQELDDRYGTEPSMVRNYMATIGERPMGAEQDRTGAATRGSFNGSHMGEIVMELLPAEERGIDAVDIERRWREICGPIPGAVELRFSADLMSAGSPVDVMLTGPDLERVDACAEDLKRELALIDGVFDITDSHRTGKPEIELDVLPNAESLGITRTALARQVRQGFYGEEAQRIQRGRDDVKVMIRYPESDRRTLHGLETMRVRTPSGDEVPFSDVALASLGRGFSTITRTDRDRSLHVTADIDSNVVEERVVQEALRAEVLPRVLANYPDVRWSFEGSKREQEDTVTALIQFFVLALFVIYALMAIPFRSYFQPIIVMTAIPFGLVGAVVGHWLMDAELSVLSMCGIVALAGVVVNDSLVLVHFVNERRDAGEPLLVAARAAGVRRFRPILLTSMTTFASLLPLMFETSVQAQFLVPMAISLGFGVLFATFITLGLVPATYLILEDLRAGVRWLTGATPARVGAEKRAPVAVD